MIAVALLVDEFVIRAQITGTEGYKEYRRGTIYSSGQILNQSFSISESGRVNCR